MLLFGLSTRSRERFDRSLFQGELAFFLALELSLAHLPFLTILILDKRKKKNET